MDTVCVVVVTYNRKKLLLECFEALRKQTRPVQGVYLIDNASTDGTPKLLLEKGYIKELPPENLTEPWEKEFEIKNLTDGEIIKLHYVRMHENTGGAGGFHEGVKRAYEKGYDWLWLMDDDGLFDRQCLKNLLNYKNKADFLAPLVININKKDELSFGIWDEKSKKLIKNLQEIKREVYENTANPFNGILISKTLIQKIGYPKKEMFIWGDEVEYLLRAQKYGMKVATISNVLFYHPAGRMKRKRVLGKFFINWQDNLLKNYCDIRNRAFILKKYNKLGIIKYCTKYTLAFFLSYLSLKEYLFFLKAFFDGLLENWGKERKFIK